jgi:hypothetical protein
LLSDVEPFFAADAAAAAPSRQPFLKHHRIVVLNILCGEQQRDRFLACH